MIVRFASTCDTCQARSDEYTEWPTCSECDEHVCPDHQYPGSLHERETERGPVLRALCVACGTTPTRCPWCRRTVTVGQLRPRDVPASWGEPAHEETGCRWCSPSDDECAHDADERADIRLQEQREGER